MKQLHAFFSGNVQGVGFRYTTLHIARGFAVTGWVKNLSDGRVELLAEGAESDLKDFLAEIRSRMQSYIQDLEVNWREASGKFQKFEINN